MIPVLQLLRPILTKRLNMNAADYWLCCVPSTIIDPVPSGGMPLAEGGISLARPCMLSGMKSWQRGDALGSCSVRFDGWAEANGAIASSRHSGIFSSAFGLTNTLWQAANENLPDGQYWRTSHCRARRRGSRIPLFTEIIKSRRAAGIYSVPRLQSLNRVGSSAMVPVRTCRRCIVL